ncbi:hypothetical protein TcG_10469 [Trypanosoma cruzi]|nr:hypothetical protein TcG_10469 [Trypanosoma cruzi]
MLTNTQRTDKEGVGRSSTRETSFNHRQRSSWALHPKPFFVNANDNSTKQREAPVGHHIWATDTPTHSLFLLLPMAWPSFTSRNTPFSQLCVPLTQALKVRFGNPKFNTSEKQRTCSQRPHGSSTQPQGLLTTLFNAVERSVGGSRVTEDGQWERCPQRRKCQGVKQKRRWEKSSQRTSPATPDVRRLIRATESQ